MTPSPDSWLDDGMTTTTYTTRHSDIQLTTVTAATISAEGEVNPVAWICKFDDERKWTLHHKGECLGSIAKNDGLHWIKGAADREAVTR